jgi:ABC-type Fe3+/spermidine/putrescine transport system ATPase subunit
MSINNRLKIHRNEIGLSQEKYGLTLGLTYNYAQKYIARYAETQQLNSNQGKTIEMVSGGGPQNTEISRKLIK